MADDADQLRIGEALDHLRAPHRMALDDFELLVAET
jgi:hypothetical protein